MTTTEARPRSSSLSRSRPTTPLRRISATSLRSLSLSHSRSRAPNASEPPLQHLSQVFAELADSVSDLTTKFEDLALVNDQLDGFNHAFASYLYGLRVNTYTADFHEAPTKLNFDLALTRQPPSPPLAPSSVSESSSPPSSPNQSSSAALHPNNMTMDSEHSFAQPRPSSLGGPSRGAGRGRGARGRGRGGAASAMTRKKKEELAAFTDSIIQTLPIKFREQQPLRGETEKVILTLRSHPAGLCMSDFQNEITVPTHRVNDALTALVRAKVVLKVFSQGITTYRFDPNKYAF